MVTARLFRDDALFDEVAQAAVAANMFLIGNGKRIVVSPIVPPGWFKIAVKIKSPARAALQVAPCAA